MREFAAFVGFAVVAGHDGVITGPKHSERHTEAGKA